MKRDFDSLRGAMTNPSEVGEQTNDTALDDNPSGESRFAHIVRRIAKAKSRLAGETVTVSRCFIRTDLPPEVWVAPPGFFEDLGRLHKARLDLADLVRSYRERLAENQSRLRREQCEALGIQWPPPANDSLEQALLKWAGSAHPDKLCDVAGFVEAAVAAPEYLPEQEAQPPHEASQPRSKPVTPVADRAAITSWHLLDEPSRGVVTFLMREERGKTVTGATILTDAIGVSRNDRGCKVLQRLVEEKVLIKPGPRQGYRLAGVPPGFPFDDRCHPSWTAADAAP